MAELLEVVVAVPGRREPIVVNVPAEGRGADLVDAVRRHGESGLAEAGEVVLFVGEDEGKVLEADARLKGSVGHRQTVHASRCRNIAVTVHFGAEDRADQFPPTAKVERVARWAAREFDARPAGDYRLELLDAGGPLDDDTRLAALAEQCQVAFELVPRELTIRYKVNAEDQVSHERFRTARTILTEAGFDPRDYYLKYQDTSYQDNPDTLIRLRDGQVFKAIYSGGGTVS
jgi:hypothetical protein